MAYVSLWRIALVLLVACAAPAMRPAQRVADEDQDGIADMHDQCPGLAEDLDHFRDDDGCPELDNDGDGFSDLVDRCPCVPENFDGYEDTDGCPECGPILQVDDSVRMRVVIVFDQDSARLSSRSESLISEVAQTFRQYEQLELVAVQGHAIASEHDPTRLASQRAAVVIASLRQYGVTQDRLAGESFGAEQPLERGANASALERSRRVEFEVREHAIPPQGPCGDDVPRVQGCG